MSKRTALDVNQIFAYRLRDIRRSKQWDQQDLADALTAIGYPMNRATISKIEAGRHGVGGEYGKEATRGQTPPRPVSLAEAIAFAVALGVSPLSILLPVTRQDDIQLTPAETVDLETAYRWVCGDRPLTPDDPDASAFYRYESQERVLAKPATIEQLKAMGVEVVVEPSRISTSKEDS